ncbi:unnamed protein product [Owenia fusiformis]|uniref:Uncharacterized protein n=1 Tax=Owenia fusiformis TaxID=6347 RepID=A0A8S4NHB3_OWEFU|nr:unnamed protein product [Owenia fusiformis]
MDIAIGGEKVEKQKIDSSYAQTEASGSFDKDESRLTTEENIANKLYDSTPSQTQSFVGVHDPESERLKIDVSSSKIVDNMPNVNSDGVTKISLMVVNNTDEDNNIEGNALEDDVSETSQTESQLGDDVAPTDVQ